MKREAFRDGARRGAAFTTNVAKYFLVLTFGLCATGWAQLRWDTRSREFHPTPFDEKVVAVFPFTNTGHAAVRITDIASSCSCTTATVDGKKIYLPGEKGKITAVFDIAGREGKRVENIKVTTTDPSEPKIVLTLTATIPKLLDMDNFWLTWPAGTELQPKIVNIKVLGDYPIHHLTVIPTSPNMVVRVRHVAGSRDFQLVVTPKKADGELVTMEITPDYPKDAPRRFHIFGRAEN